MESLHAWSGRDPACYRGHDSNAPTRLAFAGALQTDASKQPQPLVIPIKEMFHQAVPPLPPALPLATVIEVLLFLQVLSDTSGCSGCVQNKSSWLSSDRYKTASSAGPSLTPSHPNAFSRHS